MSTLAGGPDPIALLGGPGPRTSPPAPFLVVDASDDPVRVEAYRALRRRAFVDDQGLFSRHDLDDHDLAPRTRVLVALRHDGAVAGGVRIHSATDDPDLGWWQGSRLVAVGGAGVPRARVGAALVRAACARVLHEGALRFDAHVQERHRGFFARLGWQQVGTMTVRGTPHAVMRHDITRLADHATAHKAPIGDLVGALLPAGAWRGDDGVPVGDTGAVACLDAITPSMVERDPGWAGWCGALVTAHDLSAMGAAPLGMLNSLAAPDRAHAARVLEGLAAGGRAMGLPILGGHTQLGVPAALGVTGLGRTAHPVPGSGMRPGHAIALTADTAGGWRPGYGGTQWDSTSWRDPADLRAMLGAVPTARPAAAKDVSMAGIVGSVGMMAEAGGCGAELDVAAIGRPSGVTAGDWLTCFPGFAMVSAGPPGVAPPSGGPARGAVCGRAERAAGVRLRWPDGVVTTALAGPVTGLGGASEETTTWA